MCPSDSHSIVTFDYVLLNRTQSQVPLMNWRQNPRAERTKQGHICVCIEDWHLPKPVNKSECQTTYLPLIRHFSSRASSASATKLGIPTTTSALFVRRLKSGNPCASGPEKRGTSSCVPVLQRGEGWRRDYLPTAVSNGVSTGHRTSPVNLHHASSSCIRLTYVRLTCDSYDRTEKQTFSVTDNN